MGADGRRRFHAALASLLSRRVALGAALLATLVFASTSFALGRLTAVAAPAHARRLTASHVASFADATHQVALNEAAMARRQAREDGAVADGGGDAQPGAVPASPAERDPLTPGESGDAFITRIPFQVLSWEPRAVFFPNFLDAARCQHIIDIASKRLAPSSLALRKGDTAANTADVRTSQGTFLTSGEDREGVLDYVEKRMAAAAMIPQSHGEPFNVLKYDEGQKYDSHYDTFDPESYGPQASTRVATFLLYLNEWDDGGETVFLLEGKNGLDRLRNIDYKACNTGLKVKPMQAGDALLFWSVTPSGAFDKKSLHGGCPVKNGTKWTTTKWMRDKPGRNVFT